MLTLTDNQTTAVSKLSHYKVGALFMEPGEGKTLPTYRLINSVPEIDYILYLAPYNSVNPPKGKSGIREEIAKYGGFSVPHDFIGIESLSNSDRIYLQLRNKLQNARNPFIICDESLKIKNWDAKRTRRIVELGTLAQYKLILNGTPISRNLMDIWAQMEFLSPKILNMSLAQFKNIYCEYTTMIKRIGNITITREWINKYHNIDHLYSLIHHYIYEADLNIEVKEQYIDVDYKLDEKTREQYDYLKEKYLDDEKLQAMNNNIFLEMTMKMQHIYSTCIDKLNVCNTIIKENQAEKIIVFCKFLDSQAICKEKFPNVTVLSLQKHAFSLNLQEHDTIIEFDQTWDFAATDQAHHRVYRRGQQSPTVRYFRLYGNVGLETMMKQNIEKKISMLQYFKSKSIQEIKKEL